MRPNTASPWPEPDDDLEPDYSDDYFDEPRRPSTLTPGQRADLTAVLDRDLLAGGCDNTLRIAKRWAGDSGLSWPRLRSELEGNGGYCDCEIMFNVFTGDDVDPA